MAYGSVLVALGAILGALVSIFNYMSPDSGIAGTPGAVLVIISTLILFLFSTMMGRYGVRSTALRVFILISALLAILGTAFAGYMLESNALIAFMAVSLIGLIMRIFKHQPVLARSN